MVYLQFYLVIKTFNEGNNNMNTTKKYSNRVERKSKNEITTFFLIY